MIGDRFAAKCGWHIRKGLRNSMMLIMQSPGIEVARLVRFGITGVTAAIVYAAVAFLLVKGGLAKPVVASIVGFLCAATVSYLGHLYFSFRVEPDHRVFLWRFLIVTAITLAMTILLTYVITALLGRSYQIAIGAVIVLNPALSYLCSRFWVFLPGLNGRGKLPNDLDLAS